MRRLAMPVVIVLVAAALWLWDSARQPARDREVEQLVADVCREVRAGREPAGAIDPLIADPLIARLEEALSAPGALTVSVTPGDTDHAGTRAEAATHTAVIRVDGTEVLGLRVLDRRTGTILIIGYFEANRG